MKREEYAALLATAALAMTKVPERRKREFQRDNKGRGFARAIHRAAELKEAHDAKQVPK